ncbi:hypothetical protein A3B87_00045 [Candidatus Kuenenbacteria bacterium RIFCSPHIGHO2_02_FULL_39_13]|uniref:Uncharacterized protein n=1 Tax=Candidatus Kuenenbacteria bacterium RIFCSPHIGHO2_02_FULL_39_13 TaxID=1798561 RepID=A0A1F6FNP7_9BACT|nr:MAG: hypothetical protein A3B87_00045 [Candidatus Kuenenbacteria bacterium RIFCSPHIGHO2_02_FULL_39_13]
MNKLTQKNIDQYLDGKQLDQEQKERVVMAITYLLYQRNQNVIKAENESDEDKLKQFLRSIAEYDQLIEDKIALIINGKNVETYDF